MAKKTRHNPERRAFKGRSYKKAKGPKAERISALRLRDFVRDIQELMAEAEAMDSSEYVWEGVADAMKKHKIPELTCPEDFLDRDEGEVPFSGPKITVTVEDVASGKFIPINE